MAILSKKEILAKYSIKSLNESIKKVTCDQGYYSLCCDLFLHFISVLVIVHGASSVSVLHSIVQSLYDAMFGVHRN